jgi:hypothetical protein
LFRFSQEPESWFRHSVKKKRDRYPQIDTDISYQYWCDRSSLLTKITAYWSSAPPTPSYVEGIDNFEIPQTEISGGSAIYLNNTSHPGCVGQKACHVIAIGSWRRGYVDATGILGCCLHQQNWGVQDSCVHCSSFQMAVERCTVRDCTKIMCDDPILKPFIGSELRRAKTPDHYSRDSSLTWL